MLHANGKQRIAHSVTLILRLAHRARSRGPFTPLQFDLPDAGGSWTSLPPAASIKRQPRGMAAFRSTSLCSPRSMNHNSIPRPDVTEPVKLGGLILGLTIIAAGRA